MLGGNDCLASAMPCRTITHALTQAASGDTVKLVGGTYAETALAFHTTQTLRLSGGWTSDFTAHNPASDPAVALTTDVTVVADVGETIDVTLDGVSIVRDGYDAGSAPTRTAGPLR